MTTLSTYSLFYNSGASPIQLFIKFSIYRFGSVRAHLYSLQLSAICSCILPFASYPYHIYERH